jgi:hypothetical protein
MRRPLSERQAERASLAKARVRARKKASAARERRLERTKEAVKTWRRAKSLAEELMKGAREDEKHVSFAKQGVRDFERQEVRRHSHLLHRCYRCYCYTRHGSYRDGKISSYVYEHARIGEAIAHESRKLAVQARDFQRKARESATSGSSEALRRLQRVETRFYKLEDAYYKRVRDLDLEKDSLKSLYGVKLVHGQWLAEAPETLPPSVSTQVIAKRLNEWQQGKQHATGARMVLQATVQKEQAGS